MIDAKLVGKDNLRNNLLEQSMHVRDSSPGAIIYQERLLEFLPNFIPFVNPTLGIAMNQNVAFGSPDLIFDGTTGAGNWPGTGVAEWNFLDSGKVTLTNGTDNSEGLFTAAAPVDSGVSTAVTGKVDLDTYTPASQDILMQFRLAGAPLGNSVSMNDHIDTGNFAEQSFVVELSDFGLLGASIDEFTLTVVRSGGALPDIKFDDFQIEGTGSPAEFKAFSNDARDFHVKKLKFMFADALSTILEHGTMPVLSYDKILGVSALSLGIGVQIVQEGAVEVAARLRQLSDLVSIGAEIKELVSDGTNTFMTLELEFSEPIILKASQEFTSYISVTINDNLSGLLLFTGLARGAYVKAAA